MNQKEKQLLEILQSDFPEGQRPFRVIAERLRISEAALLKKIGELKRSGVIRRIGATINSQSIGYKSILIAACVDLKNLESIVSFINASESVSHNYLRDCEYNIWFTLSKRTKKEITDFIRKFKNKKGVRKVLELPAEKTIKIKAEFVL
ncbi:MAG: winged helix-turn-helix transcriptional regulator [Candidatus Omnitrophota bacterium]